MNRAVITARDVMQEDHLELEGSATIKEALIVMRQKNASMVIVKKRHPHDAFGVVLLSDIAKHVLAKDRAPERVNIYEIMSKPVIPVEADMDVRYCARMFERFGLANAPVIENGEVLGIVGYKELVFNGLCADIE